MNRHMVSLNRTAYPRFPEGFSDAELDAFYAISTEEQELITCNTRHDSGRLSLALLYQSAWRMTRL